MKQTMLSFICLCIASLSLFSQELTANKSWAVQFNTQHQDLAGEFTFGELSTVYKVPIRPAYSLEVQRSVQKKPNRKRVLSARLGYYHNLYHDRWLSATVGLGSEWSLGQRFFIQAASDVGVVWIKNADIQYYHDGEQWVQTDNYAAASTGILLNTNLDIGYRIVEGRHPIDVLLNGRLTVAGTAIGALPYYAYGVGIRYGL